MPVWGAMVIFNNTRFLLVSTGVRGSSTPHTCATSCLAPCPSWRVCPFGLTALGPVIFTSSLIHADCCSFQALRLPLSRLVQVKQQLAPSPQRAEASSGDRKMESKSFSVPACSTTLTLGAGRSNYMGSLTQPKSSKPILNISLLN